MHNTPPDYAQKLYSIISESYELPIDDYKHHQWLKPLKLRKGSKLEDNFNQLLEQTYDPENPRWRKRLEWAKDRRYTLLTTEQIDDAFRRVQQVRNGDN